MYKKAINMLLVLNLIFLFGIICVKGISQNRLASVPARDLKLDERLLATKEASTMGIMGSAISGQRIVEVQTVERSGRYRADKEELEILERIVEAEAGNQDAEGKLLIANVILNRVESEKFPDTVKEVVLQKEKGICQFSPVSSGRIWKVEVSEETSEAVERALEGEDISDGALYFAARKHADGEKMRWFDTKLLYLFEHGGHEFFR